jgi:hypothetical protein
MFISKALNLHPLNPQQNDQGRKGPCCFRRLDALKCLKCKKIPNPPLGSYRLDQLERRHCKDTPYYWPYCIRASKGRFNEGFKAKYPSKRPEPEFTDQVFAKTSPECSFSVIENERFGLVFAQTGSLNSGTGL